MSKHKFNIPGSKKEMEDEINAGKNLDPYLDSIKEPNVN
jgi:hypothetical protein